MPSRIKLLLSDVDGTLVTKDKRLTEPTRLAIGRLAEHGIGFTITSSRPLFGLTPIIAALDLKLPVGAFNGATIAEPDGTIIEEHFLPEPAAQLSLRLLGETGVGIWVFADGRWLATDPHGDYVDHETRTIATAPTIVPDFGGALARASKIVGVSRDFDRLAACEASLKPALGASASAVRSQSYYLDVTPPGIDKGTVVDFLARRLGIARDAIATIGDMDNDVAMFRKAGLAIAMGNASDAARQAAGRMTSSNEEDGVAAAIERLLADVAV